jgi:hypothetical protein
MDDLRESHELKWVFGYAVRRVLINKIFYVLNDSSTTTNMEPSPPIKDPSINDPTYQIIEPHLNKQTRTETMSRFPLWYNVQDYCRKYPDDTGNQIINNRDVVRPRDLKWAGRNEQHEWAGDNHLSTHGVPTYGTCAHCWSSGPSYDTCAKCKKDIYKPLSFEDVILDSQTLSTKMNKPHQTARAGCTHTVVRHDTTLFNPKDIAVQMHHIFEKKNAHLKNKFDHGVDLYSMRVWNSLHAFFKDYNGLFHGRGAISVHKPVKEMFQSQIEQILLPSAHNGSTTTTNMELEPPIKDGSSKDLTYHGQIVIGYTVDQQGQNIRDKDIVRPKNHNWAQNGSGEIHEWEKKSSGTCPTNGTCSLCWKAGPAGKKCTCTHGKYLILFYGLNTLDSITVADIIGQDLEVARADRMKNWNITPMMQYNELCCDLAIQRRLNQDKFLDTDAKKKK